jgi:hypothetical protein
MNLLISPGDIWAFLCWFFSRLFSTAAAACNSGQAPSDWALTGFTGLLVVVGFLQFWMLRITWKAVHTAERAWMIITPDKPEGWEPILLPEQPGVPATLNVFRSAMKNVGRTPAHVTKIAACYKNLTTDEFKNLPKQPDYGTKESLESMLLAPGDSHPKAVLLWPNSGLTNQEIQSIHTADRFLYFYACVEYADDFGKKHETRVGIHISLSPRRQL